MALRIKRSRERKAKSRVSKKTRQRRASRQRAARAREAKQSAELSRIEKVLGEDFESLAEARRALKAETSTPDPADVEIDSAAEYDRYYDEWQDEGIDFYDGGEVDGGADY